jgi:hypothetical protein
MDILTPWPNNCLHTDGSELDEKTGTRRVVKRIGNGVSRLILKVAVIWDLA